MAAVVLSQNSPKGPVSADVSTRAHQCTVHLPPRQVVGKASMLKAAWKEKGRSRAAG
jgi:hypothetical protein